MALRQGDPLSQGVGKRDQRMQAGTGVRGNGHIRWAELCGQAGKRRAERSLGLSCLERTLRQRDDDAAHDMTDGVKRLQRRP